LNRNKLDKAIERILFEDMSFGLHSKVSTIHDRPITSGEPDVNFKPNMASTMQSSVPLRPSELMATQLADERPPIEDLEYAPVSVPALKAAVAAIADLVPPDQVTRFYRRAQELLDDAVERQAEGEIAKSAEVEEEMKKSEDNEEKEDVMTKNTKNESIASRQNNLSKLIRILSEATNPYDAAVAGMGGDEFDPAPVPTASTSEDVDENILKDLAIRYGFGSDANAMRQALQRLFNLMQYLISKVNITSLEKLMEDAVPDFVDTAVESGFIDEEDREFLIKNPQHVRETDSFRFYFNQIYRSVYRSLVSDSEKRVRLKMVEVGIPAAIQDTVYNQITGGSAKKMSTIIKRLQKSGASDQQIGDALKIVRDNFDEFQRSIKDLPSFLEDVREEVMGADKAEIVEKAFRLAGEWQEEEAARVNPTVESRKRDR